MPLTESGPDSPVRQPCVCTLRLKPSHVMQFSFIDRDVCLICGESRSAEARILLVSIVQSRRDVSVCWFVISGVRSIKSNVYS
jgi:hypothetical protein